ncbi:D-glycero-alpha-D-manno-heptose-1,7-bisphosphate 7-phosphatase ['Paenibacillus yunnanensis' Narsing Rao et al. 2020]|uniref:D-glycero-alpha-D-manno-heptose-1,7-bisphosphate 7-phosphatase n=1 Tax=Paenibacillus tengchongensis TaxID=2608684 RepID=UPI00124F1237|nr:HAD family hydrolase [Paenibacillus tengchongensis]
MSGRSKGTRAVFLDRDGVLTEVRTRRVCYVNQPEDVHLLPGAAEAVAGLHEAGYKVFIVTNQGGVGLGHMSLEDLAAVHERLEALLAESGAYIDEIAACTHRPRAGCPCRKPQPGMLLELASRHGINLAQSYMVGDMASDIRAGQAAGTMTVHIASRKGRPAGAPAAELTAGSLLEAAVLIIRRLASGEPAAQTEHS